MITKTIDKKEIAYTYDANGNQLTITDETGKTARIYDGLNRVITKSVPHLGASTYEYDIPVNSQTVPEMTASYTLPEGSTAEKTTDAKGNETTKIYDGAGRLAYVISEGKVTGYTYDANGSRQSVKYPDGATEEKYEYDKNNRLKKLTNLKKDGTILEEYKYTYDGAGNQTTKTETIKGKEKGTTAYRYDSLNRLLEVTEPQQETGSRKTTGYTYDASGNRETEQVQAKTATGTAITLTTYKNDEQNRLVAATEEKGDGTKKTTTYVYDNNGNLTRKSMEQTREIDPSNPPKAKFGMYIEGQKDGATKNAKPIVAGTASYEYDVWNQLVKATTGEGTSTYKYNGEGYRTEKTENGKTTRSLYEGDKVILETDENGKETARNIYGTNLLQRTVTTRENGNTKEETYSYMYNGHGDVTALLGADGTVAASYYYDAFGNITEQTGSVNNNITYAGYQYDKETDLYYLNARMYDAKTARFLQEDTYLGNAGDPLSLNLYTYCHNEPVMYVDPTGHTAATIKVGNVPIGNAKCSNGVSTGNLTDIVDGLGGKTTTTTTTKGVYTVTIPNAVTGKNVTLTLNTKTNKIYDKNGNELLDVKIENNKTQVEVKQLTNLAGVSDTVSWWIDSNKQTNVVVQPDMKGAAVQVTRSGNAINVNAYIEFTGDYKDIFPGTNITYADVAAAGILNKWNNIFTGNQYDFSPGQKITLNTKIYSNQKSSANLWTSATFKQKNFVEININNTNPTMIFGIRKEWNVPHMSGGQGEWSINNEKEITMYRSHSGDPNEYGQDGYSFTAAHEFGHVLGLGDAYGYAPGASKEKMKENDNRPEAPNTIECPNLGWKKGGIMRDNGVVTANDVEMVWEAWSTNEWQYFTNYNGHNKSRVIRSY